MTEIREGLRYTSDHEWVRLDDSGNLFLGITDHAQELLGELVYVDLPDSGQSFARGDACAVVESVKAASDVYCPLEGDIVEINGDLEEQPELVNSSPYDEGWLVQILPAGPEALEEMMSAEDYAQFLAESED